VGALVSVTMQNYRAAFGEWVLIIQGVVFVIVVLAFRKGIVGEFTAWLERRERRKQSAEKEAAAPRVATKPEHA